MSTKKQKKLLALLFLISFALLISGCVSIPNTRAVSVLGVVADGASWGETQTSKSGDLSLNELLDMLEPQPARACVPVPGFNICRDIQAGQAVRLPARAGAIIQSAEDWNALNVALEQACRQLGSQCSVSIQNALYSRGKFKVK